MNTTMLAHLSVLLALGTLSLTGPTLSRAEPDTHAGSHAHGSAGKPAAAPQPTKEAPRTEASKKSAVPAPAGFTPPEERDIPNNEFGETVRFGKLIFTNTQQYAKAHVGNGLNCANCHLDRGRRADSAPLWAAYVLYPAYRKKTGKIDTLQSRIQGCFDYSMNGSSPAIDSKEMTALVSYHYWLARNAPTGVKLKGQGFVKLPPPDKTPDLARGKQTYKNNCAICHGDDGHGTKAQGQYAFPPLWGPDSFNWGAGMHRIDTAAGFIKVNMPYGRFGTLSDQEAWDVALYMNSHDRPKDPRFKHSLEKTRDEHHDENCLYGRTPAELAARLAKSKKPAAASADKEKKPAAADAPAAGEVPRWDGYSPATAH